MARPVFWALVGGWLLIGVGGGIGAGRRVDRRTLYRKPA